MIRLSITLPDYLHTSLHALAQTEHRSISNEITWILIQHLIQTHRQAEATGAGDLSSTSTPAPPD